MTPDFCQYATGTKCHHLQDDIYLDLGMIVDFKHVRWGSIYPKIWLPTRRNGMITKGT